MAARRRNPSQADTSSSTAADHRVALLTPGVGSRRPARRVRPSSSQLRLETRAQTVDGVGVDRTSSPIASSASVTTVQANGNRSRANAPRRAASDGRAPTDVRIMQPS